MCWGSALRPRRAAVPKPGNKEVSSNSSWPLPVACGETEEPEVEVAGLGHRLSYLCGWKDSQGGLSLLLVASFFFPSPRCHLNVWLPFCSLACLPPSGRTGFVQAPVVQWPAFLRSFAVRLIMKNKTPRHSWSSLQWLKRHCAHSKWHKSISRTVWSWTVPCSCAHKKFI